MIRENTGWKTVISVNLEGEKKFFLNVKVVSPSVV